MHSNTRSIAASSSTPVAAGVPIPPLSTARVAIRILIGLAIAALVAGAALGLHRVPQLSGLSGLILAIVLGMLVRNTVGLPHSALPGVQFAIRRVLRWAIVLLGLQLGLAEVVELGGTGVAIVALTLACTFVFTVWAGRKLGVPPELAQLIAAGTSICGASAVVAANTVVGGSDDEVAYGVAIVTVFGSASMLLFPALLPLLHLSARDFGLWTGASIHEIAQVVAAAFQGGPDAGQFGTISKLTRVMMLAPTVLVLGLLKRRGGAAAGSQGSQSVPVPWFVLGFIVVIGLNSTGWIPAEARSALIALNQFLLAVALAAMGLSTDVRALARRGVRPMLLGALAWLFIAVFSLCLIKLSGLL
jgi:uncharacterized integral membrane protein (TIGR00698 family)